MITKTRNSNLELYRVLCMLGIVLHHFCVHGFALEFMDYGLNKYVVDMLSSWGKVGVDGFILISSYFMVNSKFTVNKFLRIWGQVMFYTVGIFVAFWIAGEVQPVMFKYWLRASFMPISYSMYWFVTYYFVLMILSPFINAFVHKIEQKMLKRLILLLVVMWSILYGVFDMDYAFSMFGWFVTLYLVAGYIRLYYNCETCRAKRYGWLSFALFVLILGSSAVRNLLGAVTGNAAFWSTSRKFIDQEQDILVFGFALCFFLFFLNRKEWNSRVVNYVASLSFGVYLCHDNYFTRTFLWMVWFDPNKYVNEAWLGLWMLGVGLGVYVVCSLIDGVRKGTVERLWILLVNWISPKIERLIER